MATSDMRLRVRLDLKLAAGTDEQEEARLNRVLAALAAAVDQLDRELKEEDSEQGIETVDVDF